MVLSHFAQNTARTSHSKRFGGGGDTPQRPWTPKTGRGTPKFLTKHPKNPPEKPILEENSFKLSRLLKMYPDKPKKRPRKAKFLPQIWTTFAPPHFAWCEKFGRYASQAPF